MSRVGVLQVTITYQPLGDFQQWQFDNNSGANSSGVWHLYMLRGVANTDQKPQPFTFNINQVQGHGKTPVENGSLEANFPDGYLLPLTYSKGVVPGATETVPYGTGVFFMVFEDGANAPGSGIPFLQYAGKPNESVVMTVLDVTKPPKNVGTLNKDTLETLHSDQNNFEANYLPDGTKQ